MYVLSQCIDVDACFQYLTSKPLPNRLSSPLENAPTKSDRFASTTGTVHCRMPSSLRDEFEQPLLKKAPSLLRVHYNLDTIHKVRPIA